MENEKIEEHDAHDIEFDFGMVVKDFVANLQRLRDVEQQAGSSN